MTLRFVGLPHLQVYRSAGCPAWAAGVVREVDEALGAYLLETFPEAFEVERPAGPVLAPVNASMGGDYVARSTILADAYQGRHWRSICEDIAGGELDEFLDEVQAEELERARPRASILAAIAARRS